ncbi:MAG TPA: hypothetical protein VKC56_05535 [Gallionellaceae bacterium]|nr:hypothetical protein [Gallionellaceae bacterium]
MSDEAKRNAQLIKFQEAFIQLQSSVHAMQVENTSLLRKIGDLEKQIMESENWDREIERYQLQPIGQGVFAFALKPGMENGEPPHLLCAKCVNDGKKSILQTRLADEFGRIYVCHTCGSELRVDSGRSPDVQRNYDPLA